MRRFRPHLIIRIAAVLLLLWACGIWGFRNRAGTSATAAGAPLGDLPSDATDVRWFLPGAFGPNTLYEFKTSEANYEQWVRNRRSRVSLDGPKRCPFRVLRYDHATGAMGWRNLANTIAYTWNEEDRSLYMVYDLDEGRAFYEWHSR